MSFFIGNIIVGQTLSTTTPFYTRDSIYITGKVADELGKPVENALILFSPFYSKKFDVTWIEKDTFLTTKDGSFLVNCTRSQLSDGLYFKKSGYLPSRKYMNLDSNKINFDTSIILYNRHRNWFDAKTIEKSDIGISVSKALKKYKINFKESYIQQLKSSNVSRKALRAETSDSSMILLIVNDYTDTFKIKSSILNKKITGIGIAFKNGQKVFFGNSNLYERKVYNEYFLEGIARRDK